MPVINTNASALSAQNVLKINSREMNSAMQQLASGTKVGSAKDDAAGLAIAERMSSQVRGMNVAVRNANDGISMAQTAEGALGKSSDILQRMRELAVQAANSSNSDTDKLSLDNEFEQLSLEVQRVYSSTTYNSRAILADDAGSQIFQVGANTTADNQITIETADMASSNQVIAVTGGEAVEAYLGLDGVAGGADPDQEWLAGADIDRAVITGDAEDILKVIDAIDAAINFVSSERSVLGAAQSRFENAISYLQISSENQSASRSRIMDADYAQETANLSRAQILSQAGSAMLAQANQQPQSVLALLRG
jgi:flagellin